MRLTRRAGPDRPVPVTGEVKPVLVHRCPVDDAVGMVLRFMLTALRLQFARFAIAHQVLGLAECDGLVDPLGDWLCDGLTEGDPDADGL